MRFAQPIRDKNIIQALKSYYKSQDHRSYMLFTLGINTGLRISDLINLKVSHFFEPEGVLKPFLTINEQKTDKRKTIGVNKQIKEELTEYIDTLKLNNNDYLFPSKKGGYISRVQAYRLLKKGSNTLKISDFGTHTMRKTFGYWVYKTTQNIALLMDIFNHSSQRITLRYIGINQDQKDSIYTKVGELFA